MNPGGQVPQSKLQAIQPTGYVLDRQPPTQRKTPMTHRTATPPTRSPPRQFRVRQRARVKSENCCCSAYGVSTRHQHGRTALSSRSQAHCAPTLVVTEASSTIYFLYVSPPTPRRAKADAHAPPHPGIRTLPLRTARAERKPVAALTVTGAPARAGAGAGQDRTLPLPLPRSLLHTPHSATLISQRSSDGRDGGSGGA